MSGILAPESESWLARVEELRLAAGRASSAAKKSHLGQFLTPVPIARLMASMVAAEQPEVVILDPGAGVGSLFAALVGQLLERPQRPHRITVRAIETDPDILEYLRETANLCAAACATAGIDFRAEVIDRDFLDYAAEQHGGILFVAPPPDVTCAILNPPYRKIGAASSERRLLRALGLETSNLYAGFVWACVGLLAPGGEMVAITPRSFCNGPYFESFRKAYLAEMSLRRVHLFESRARAFREDAVLQENVIFHAARERPQGPELVVTSADGGGDETLSERRLRFEDVVRPDDPRAFLHLVADEIDMRVVERMRRFTVSLDELGLRVSTGKVVDFRAREFLRLEPASGTAPLIYPGNISRGAIHWPRPGRKPQALLDAPETQDLLVDNSVYVLVKRFSSKEERKRLVAAVYDPVAATGPLVGFENHLNYFRGKAAPISMRLARGLAAFLNSTLVDCYFRQFNGHTQVNAADLRSFRYPSRRQLERLGERLEQGEPGQDELDELIEAELPEARSPQMKQSPIKAKRKVKEALAILKALGLPREQQNERSALTLLALLDLKPGDPWSAAAAPLRGITPMTDFFAGHYGKRYAANTRETVRRQTVHQFLRAGLILENPDEPARPVNSPKAVYQIEGGALELLRIFGSPAWDAVLPEYIRTSEALTSRYLSERKMLRVPVEFGGHSVALSPGGQNVLIQKVVEEFAPRFTPGGAVLYIGDAGEKWAYVDEAGFADLGLRFDPHGKMPDVAIYYAAKDWLVLVEAVTSHGPVNPQRHGELKRLFGNAKPGLVFVTAFLTRRAMARHRGDISWETEVWMAEEPSHLIHYNGERFLGPY